MNNSVSERSFYIESDDEEEKFIKQEDDDDDDGGNVSDSSDSSTEHQQQNKPNSYTTSWPQSYRQSIDMLSSVQSPSIGFLGTPTLSRLGSSFLSSSLVRRHTPEVLPGLSKPLLPTVEDEQKLPPKWRSSHTLLPPRKSSIRPTEASFKGSQLLHQVPVRQSTFGQAVLNGMNFYVVSGSFQLLMLLKKGDGQGSLYCFCLLCFHSTLGFS